jgi:hypothetical protein
MTDITVEPYVFSGSKQVIIYELNANNRPDGSKADGAGAAYTGLELYGFKTYNLTIPPARRIAHIGNDRLLKQQVFPPIEPATGEISVGATNLEIIAALTGATIVNKAGMRILPHMSDLQGAEPNVGMIMYQAAIAQSGSQRWRFHMIPNTKAIVREPGAAQEPVDLIFDLAPDPVDKYLWGGDLSVLSDPSDPFSGVSESGADNAGIWSGFCAYRPRIAAFSAQADQVAFSFPADKQAADATNVEVVAVLGTGTPVVVDAGDYTATTAAITFDTAPVTTYGAGVEILVLYQIADS